VSGVRVLAVVGNPRPASRTLGVARAVAERIAAAHAGAVVAVIDLAERGAELLDPGSAQVAADVAELLAADVLVVASPTYKATYTGLLKLFLDRIAGGALGGTPAVPVMTGGAANHALSVDVHLRPLLIELGASCPTQALYVLEAQLPDLANVIETWWASAGAVLAPRP
jgi:FMN reductase